MREIIFRGKRLDDDEWIEGYYVRATHHWHKYGVHEDWIIAGAAANGGWFAIHERRAVDPATVGQCTGLKDKNGKWIFEGDILRVFAEESGQEGDGVCVVHFGRFKDTDSLPDFDHFGWYITVSTLPGEAITIFALEEDGIAFEVIGNIHDNPGLLEATV